MIVVLKVPNELLYENLRIIDVKKELGDVVTLSLRTSNKDSPLLKAKPGQFNMLYLYGIGEVPISYSVLPDRRGIFKHTIRRVGTVTRVLVQLKAGDMVGARGPYGSGWPYERAIKKDVLMVAGGLGLAPIRPLIHLAIYHRKKFNNVTLLYGARNPSSLLYYDEFELWRKKIDVRVTVDKRDGTWKGNVGVVTTLFKGLELDPTKTVAFICGPEIMMRFTVLELIKKRVPDDDIFLSFERNMKCGIGFCGHCQMGPYFVCRDGPVFSYSEVKPYFGRGEI